MSIQEELVQAKKWRKRVRITLVVMGVLYLIVAGHFSEIFIQKIHEGSLWLLPFPLAYLFGVFALIWFETRVSSLWVATHLQSGSDSAENSAQD